LPRPGELLQIWLEQLTLRPLDFSSTSVSMQHLLRLAQPM
jgi:hypothetical protein